MQQLFPLEGDEIINSKKASAKRTALIVLCVVLAVILTALIGVTIYMESLFGLINKTDPNATQNYMFINCFRWIMECDPEGNPFLR